jgi:hypothetical protein
MAVNIQVDEPEIDIRVRTYDGYVEVTGIAAPLAVGDAQVVKGDLIDAGPATTALVVGGAETTKGNTVEGGASTALMTGDATTQKGNAVAADGTDVQVAVGDAETSEGEATQAEGASTPLAVGNAKTEHLKPPHRWQMPQPRNLIESTETDAAISFNPNSTRWNYFNTTYSLVNNVGPNGEAAAKLAFSGTRDGIVSPQDTHGVGDFTCGAYVRAVSGTASMRVELSTSGGDVDGPWTTISTEWQWVSFAANSEDAGSGEDAGGMKIISDSGENIYLLRAGLNRGSSLEYSTRSEVPQEIPDVVQGADLSNGSTTGADTNDLDFGVDGEGVPYAVSDGDDFSNCPDGVLGSGTWAFRVYHPAGSAGTFSGVLGNEDNRFLYLTTPSPSDELRVYDGNSELARIEISWSNSGISEQGWYEYSITLVDSDYIRFTANGYSKTKPINAELGQTQDKLITTGGDSTKYSHLEKHPVLSEAEAEAVRQRLAQNPTDPVPVTEAWDLSAETSPHNLNTYSEEVGSAANFWNLDTINRDVVTAPDGTTTADAFVENTNINGHGIYKESIGYDDNRVALTCYMKKAGLNYSLISAYASDGKSGKGATFNLDTGVVANKGSEIYEAKITNVGNDWYRCSVIVEATGDDRLTISSMDGPEFDTHQGIGAESIYVWGASVCRVSGDNFFPPYVSTTGSIAFPQTLPALRDSTNDLTLGSSGSADTNDPSWVAPIGVAHDSDDILAVDDTSPVRTWVFTTEAKSNFNYAKFIGDNNTIGWSFYPKGGNPEAQVYLRDNGNGEIGSVYQDLSQYVVWAIVLNSHTSEARLYRNGQLAPEIDGNGGIDMGTGSFISNDENIVKMTHLHYYNRALTDEEALYARQCILDNPQSPHPEYTNP